MTDMDGTLVPLDREGVPTTNVAKAVTKALEKVHVGIATGRPPHLVLPVAHSLGLSGPAVVQGGARVIDLTSGDVLYEQTMLPEDCEYILDVITDEKINLLIDDGEKEVPFTREALSLKALGLYSAGILEEEAQRLHDRLKGHPTITTHIVHSWTKGKFQILLSHTSATKQHGILKVSEILGIDPAEMIGVGDGNNDFPLLLACGLKVAMGNAPQALKDIADYVAPSVSDDGLAHVIEKFILHP